MSGSTSKIIDDCAENPGHLGSSLGVVELTVALHYTLDTPYDNLIWDVGHQSYAHKILTGRKELFKTKRIYGGISGFPKISESEYDSFGTGHSSTSISAALGMAIAAKMSGEESRQSIAVIGDGAMTGGMAFEALNNAGVYNSNLLVILNDNNMAIDPNVGGLNEYLLDITTSKGYNKIKQDIWNVLGKERHRTIMTAVNLLVVGILIYSAVNFTFVLSGYRGNAEINQINHAKMLEAKKNYQVNGEKTERIELYKLKDDRFANIMPYQPSHEGIEYWMKSYYELPMDVPIFWQRAGEKRVIEILEGRVV